ncbi:MAG: hypothetical protein RLZZ361_941 [Cyanobacteriota bacterium]|jgi:hypothetical protein
MQLLPIINLCTPGNNIDYPLKNIYTTAIKNISKYFPEVEISIASENFWQNLPEICKQAERYNIKLNFGSLLDIESTKNLYKTICKYYSCDSTKFFSPIYVSEIDSFCSLNKLIYVPGIQDLGVFDLSQKLLIKVFPCSCNSAQDFFKLLQGPYPELRQKTNQNRVFFFPEEEKIITQKIYYINTPQDYQNIRCEFIKDPNISIVFKNQAIQIQELVKKLRDNLNKNLKLYATGFKLFDSTCYEELYNLGFDFYATRVFNKINYRINPEEQMVKELEYHLSFING